MWAAYFVPRWISSHEENSGKQTEKFNSAMRSVTSFEEKKAHSEEKIAKHHQVRVRRIVFTALATILLGNIVTVAIGLVAPIVLAIPSSALLIYIFNVRRQIMSTKLKQRLVGPVICRAHLAPYLPNHPLDDTAGPKTGPGPVSSAPFGSASILPISWSYIRMMGGEGLTKATSVAILSANYLAQKLDPHFPVLYKGRNGFIAHECIIDLREITKNTGVTVEDVAKRLMDYGFHAPTVSFPVAGTLMIEPTESEDLRELDRFLNAMLSIRAEISDIEKGLLPVEESPLRGAPHIANEVLSDKWEKKYSRQTAAMPAEVEIAMGHRGKYWPTVGRIDGVYGDRNLVCACLPIESYA